jgi:cation:H+ antiporter
VAAQCRFEDARSLDSVLISTALIGLGLVLLIAGGEAILRGAVGLATILRLSPAVIGLTVVAAGTSVPELAVSGIAAAQGKSDLAVANVVGSNIFNITVIVGLCALLRPLAIEGNTIRLEYPVLVIVTLACLAIAQDGAVNWLDGTLCLTIYVGFTAYLVSLVREQLTREEAQELAAEVDELTPDAARPRAWVSLALVTAGMALLAGGAQATVQGASAIARHLGWSERIIGLTIVSAGTGLPEVVASVVSSIRGRSDVAIGNVIGSNLFNICGTLGMVSLATPLPVHAELFDSDCWWMLGVTLLIFPIMFTGLKVNRWEGGVLLTTYGVYMWLLLSRA